MTGAHRRRFPVLSQKCRGLIRIVAVCAIGALLATVAIVVDGFDVKQTPLNASSIWALQSGEGNRYARINTDLGELDTVKTVPAPSELVQTDATVLLYAQNNEKVVDVSLAAPKDLGDDAADYDATPAAPCSARVPANRRSAMARPQRAATRHRPFAPMNHR